MSLELEVYKSTIDRWERGTVEPNENYKDSNCQNQTKTEWYNLIAWGKTYDIIEKYFTKGEEIAIEGKLTNRSYETKEGEKRYMTEVSC